MKHLFLLSILDVLFQVKRGREGCLREDADWMTDGVRTTTAMEVRRTSASTKQDPDVKPQRKASHQGHQECVMLLMSRSENRERCWGWEGVSMLTVGVQIHIDPNYPLT